jgi:hypothetical protein
MKIKYFEIVVVLLLATSTLMSQSISKVGTTSMTFLKVDAGARQVGMGSACVANIDNALGLYWNPAGIARLQNMHAAFNHINWIADIKYSFAAIGIPLGDAGSIGISAIFVTMDPIKRTTVDYPDGTGETFDAGNHAIALTYARNLTDRFAVGGSAKIVNESIYNCSATGVAFDFGLLFNTRFNGLKMGMSISNYGTKVRMDGRDLLVQKDIDENRSGNNETVNAVLKTESYDLPLFFRVGLSMDVLKGLGNSNLILSVDALHPNDDVEYVNIGAEYMLYNMLALRGGYKALGAIDSEEGLSLGAGFKMSMMQYQVALDYAWRDFGRLGGIQMFMIGLRF